jgi:hypothetical protein
MVPVGYNEEDGDSEGDGEKEGDVKMGRRK